MTEPGPSPDDGDGHDESSVPEGHDVDARPVTPDDSSVIDLRGQRALRAAGPPPHSGTPPLPIQPGPVPTVQAAWPSTASADAAPATPSDDSPSHTGTERASVSEESPRVSPLDAPSAPSGRPSAPQIGGIGGSGPTTPTAHPPLGASRAVVRAALPLLAVLVLTVCATGLVSHRSVASARAAAELERAVDGVRTVQLASDELWTGVLGLVAGGVGQEVVTADEVVALVGAARSNPPGPLPGDSRAADELRDATTSHTRFVDAARAALDANGADPVDLGNGLAELSDTHRRTTEDTEALVAVLETRAQDELDASRGLQAAALVLALVGAVLAVLAGLAARRRVQDLVDLPAGSIATTMDRFASGDVAARSGLGDRDGLGALATVVDADLDRVSAEFDRLHRRAEWGEQSRMIFEALDEAEDEEAAHDVIQRALSMIDDDHHPVELLLAERGSTRLRSVAADPTVARPGCPVDNTGACVALRRGQVAVFDSSESINACPKLRDRPGGPCAAVCVPVTVATRPVGVLHMTGPEHAPPGPQVTDRLVTLSVQVGNRLGALRTLESTRKEASTDGLTGLPNRRMLESEVATLLERGTPFVMVLADLDKFKKLNDNFGHEIGDKALQLFAGVLRDNVRGNDVVSRLGGEEFVLVYPNMSVEISIEAIGRLRQALARAIAASRLPSFTCSFGVSHSDVGGDGDSILRVADAGLLRAKELGGDQAVFADEDLAASVFSNGDGPVGRSRETKATESGHTEPAAGDTDRDTDRDADTDATDTAASDTDRDDDGRHD